MSGGGVDGNGMMRRTYGGRRDARRALHLHTAVDVDVAYACHRPAVPAAGTGAKPIVHAGGTVPLDNILLHSVVATPVPV